MGSSVPIPFVGGMLRASATALFYAEPTKGQFRLRPGDTALPRIGNPGPRRSLCELDPANKRYERLL